MMGERGKMMVPQAGVIPRKGDITQAVMKRAGRLTRAWVDFGGGIDISAMYSRHSAGMSSRDEERLETVWRLNDWNGSRGPKSWE